MKGTEKKNMIGNTIRGDEKYMQYINRNILEDIWLK